MFFFPSYIHCDYTLPNHDLLCIPINSLNSISYYYSAIMSSKQASTVNLTAANIANIKATMKNLEGLSVNWAGVKDETGVSSNGNA